MGIQPMNIWDDMTIDQKLAELKRAEDLDIRRYGLDAALNLTRGRETAAAVLVAATKEIEAYLRGPEPAPDILF